MKICLLSEFSGIQDEGMRKIAFYLDRELSQSHEVLHLCLRPLINIFLPPLWLKIKSFRPDLIHFIPGPTIKAFLLVKALHLWYPAAKTVMTAANPVLSAFSERFVTFLKPDLILTQSRESEVKFGSLGCRVSFLANGVDTDTFIPVTDVKKRELRAKYGFGEKEVIALHIGPLRKGRNVLFLDRIRRETGIRLLIVASLSTPMEREVYQELENGGCTVWRRYFENIAEIYALTDCYIFPTISKGNSIEIPLSVLEAMSCNLPVVSTPFGALPELFSEGDGLNFAGNEEDFISLIQAVIEDNKEVKTRQKVMPYSWENIVSELENRYHQVMEGS